VATAKVEKRRRTKKKKKRRRSQPSRCPFLAPAVAAAAGRLCCR
jgi:hypothetical protein